jgi:hypothetical protein
VLKFPKFANFFEVHINVNGFAIGIMLIQEHLIAFETKKLVGA